MIKEFIKGFISVPVDLYNSIGPQDLYMLAHMLGRIVCIIFIIFIIAVICAIVMNIIDSKNEHNYDDYDFM